VAAQLTSHLLPPIKGLEKKKADGWTASFTIQPVL
jgi:hypothetical protein